MRPEVGVAASITASPRSFSIRAPSSDPLAFRVLAWCTVALAIGLLTASVLANPDALSIRPAAFAGWTAMVVLASASSVTLGHDIQLTFDMPVLLAAAYLFGPTIGGLMGLLGSFDARELRGRISLTNALFNHAQVALSVMFAGYLFILAGGRGASWPLLLLPVFAGVIGDMVGNTLLAVLGGALKLRMAWINVLTNLKFGRPAQFALSYLGFGLLAVVLVSAYRDAGQWALAEFIVPLLLARQVFADGRKLDAQAVEVKRAQRALTDVTSTIAEERQDERARIAAALHDDVQQALYNATLHAEVIREELKTGRLLALEDDVPRLLQANQAARSLLREVIKNLTRSEFGVGGLASTLRLLVADLSSTWKGRIEAHAEEAGGTPEVQLLVYQIAREALLNAVRHSRGSSIQIRLFRDGGDIGLLVMDDGQGFQVEAVDPDQHFGLEIMRERAHLAGGTLEINSRSGEGTKIVGVFPAVGRSPGA
jgi:signal transduction histidine kinase